MYTFKCPVYVGWCGGREGFYSICHWVSILSSLNDIRACAVHYRCAKYHCKDQQQMRQLEEWNSNRKHVRGIRYKTQRCCKRHARNPRVESQVQIIFWVMHLQYRSGTVVQSMYTKGELGSTHWNMKKQPVNYARDNENYPSIPVWIHAFGGRKKDNRVAFGILGDLQTYWFARQQYHRIFDVKVVIIRNDHY